MHVIRIELVMSYDNFGSDDPVDRILGLLNEWLDPKNILKKLFDVGDGLKTGDTIPLIVIPLWLHFAMKV
jgi:hypothetical protein